GGPDANTTKTHYVVLPEPIECYTLEMYDSFEDGWQYGSTPHGVEIFANDQTTSVFQLLVGRLNFGGELITPAAFRTDGTMDSQAFEAANFAVYPNPTS